LQRLILLRLFQFFQGTSPLFNKAVPFVKGTANVRRFFGIPNTQMKKNDVFYLYLIF